MLVFLSENDQVLHINYFHGLLLIIHNWSKVTELKISKPYAETILTEHMLQNFDMAPEGLIMGWK